MNIFFVLGDRLCEWLEIETQLYTLSELHQKMVQIAKGTYVYTRNQYLKQQLQIRYGDRIFFADVNGKSDVVCFKNVATSVISEHKTETMESMDEEHIIQEQHQQQQNEEQLQQNSINK